MYDPSLFRLDDSVALITGAGIGRSIAETFAVRQIPQLANSKNLPEFRDLE